MEFTLYVKPKLWQRITYSLLGSITGLFAFILFFTLFAVITNMYLTDWFSNNVGKVLSNVTSEYLINFLLLTIIHVLDEKRKTRRHYDSFNYSVSAYVISGGDCFVFGALGPIYIVIFVIGKHLKDIALGRDIRD